MLKCPHCQNRLLHGTSDGVRIRVKGPILAKSDGVETQCFWCGMGVTIPLKLDAQVQLEDLRLTRPGGRS